MTKLKLLENCGMKYICTDDLLYVIISSGNGIHAVVKQVVSIRPNEDIKIFDSLNAFLDFISK